MGMFGPKIPCQTVSRRVCVTLASSHQDFFGCHCVCCIHWSLAQSAQSTVLAVQSMNQSIGRPKDNQTVRVWICTWWPNVSRKCLWWSANAANSYTNAMAHVFSRLLRDGLCTPGLYNVTNCYDENAYNSYNGIVALVVTWVAWWTWKTPVISLRTQGNPATCEDKHSCGTCSHWRVRYEKYCAVQVQVSVCQENSALLTSYWHLIDIQGLHFVVLSGLQEKTWGNSLIPDHSVGIFSVAAGRSSKLSLPWTKQRRTATVEAVQRLPTISFLDNLRRLCRHNPVHDILCIYLICIYIHNYTHDTYYIYTCVYMMYVCNVCIM